MLKDGKHLYSIECSDDVNKARITGTYHNNLLIRHLFGKEYKMFIDGEWVDSDTKKTFETLNPENNKPWAVVPEASANDVDRAKKAARKAFEGEWPKLIPRERGKYLRAIADKLRKNAELLGEIETIDTKKLFRETKKQANYIAEYYDYYAMADKVEGTVLPIDKPNIQAITTRVPIGVIAMQLFLGTPRCY